MIRNQTLGGIKQKKEDITSKERIRSLVGMPSPGSPRWEGVPILSVFEVKRA